MRAVILVALALALAGCRKDPPSKPQDPDPALAATPIVAPMRARERLLDDLREQNRAAREREAAFDELTNRDR